MPQSAQHGSLGRERHARIDVSDVAYGFSGAHNDSLKGPCTGDCDRTLQPWLGCASTFLATRRTRGHILDRASVLLSQCERD